MVDIRGTIVVQWFSPKQVGVRQLLSWVLTLCALLGLNLTPPGVVDRMPLFALDLPVGPNEEDDSAPSSEDVAPIEVAREAIGSGLVRPNRNRTALLRPHSHTPSSYQTSEFRTKPDHFRNGLGTPFRC